MPSSNHKFKANAKEIGYKLFMPECYLENKDELFPLFLFLHGMKKRGNNLSLLDNYGLLQVAEDEPGFRYVILAPQCPEDTYWPENRICVLELLDRIIHDNRIDRNRIYVTGFSMGGNGTWDMAAYTEGIFAAAVPISGWYETEEAHQLTSIPIWVFHGELDDVVPISKSEVMVNTLKSMGNEPRFTRYVDLNHSHKVMKQAFTNPELYEWLERNRKAL